MQRSNDIALVRLGRACLPTIRYWMETEVHVYAFSIAANVLLSFFPFLIVMISVCRYILHWEEAEQAVLMALNDFFPGEVGAFIERNLLYTVRIRGPLQIGSLILLFFTANGIFEPLEVALNRAWGITENRSFLGNQVISLGMIFLVGALALLSAVLTGANYEFALQIAGGNRHLATVLQFVVFKSLAIPLTILILFLIYWVLPNRRLPARQILPVSIGVGLALEALKYVNLLTLPWLRPGLVEEYGPFVNSVTILLWSWLAAMIMLAGAEWSARRGIVHRTSVSTAATDRRPPMPGSDARV
jgi:YihY family inner membrane protein